jgi:hypothetical protein
VSFFSGKVAQPLATARASGGSFNPNTGGFKIPGVDNQKINPLSGAFDRINPIYQQDRATRQKGRDDYEIDQKMSGVENTGNEALKSADQTHLGATKSAVSDYKGSQSKDLATYTSALSDLMNDSKKQSQNTQATYTNDVLPALQSVLNKQKVNADGAMTLQQAQDPNNPLATQIRDMYDQLGQRERQRGQQDYGVLAALGAQAAGQQFGNLPMTSGQMGQIMGANQRQAGDAYARAQNRMYDLQQQGIDRGFDDTKYWYEQGQNAIDKYGNAAKDIQNASTSHAGTMGAYRQEQGGYAGETYGAKSAHNQNNLVLDSGLADLEKGNVYAGTGRETATTLGQLGRDQERLDKQYETDMAKYGANAVLFGKSLEGAGNMGGFATGIGSGMAASDRRVKSQIGDVKRSHLKEFFSAIKPKKYRYKNPNTSVTRPGQRYGFMLQDVQNTRIGKQITKKLPDGTLAYDKDNLQGVLVAALADNYRGKLRAGRKKGH